MRPLFSQESTSALLPRSGWETYCQTFPLLQTAGTRGEESAPAGEATASGILVLPGKAREVATDPEEFLFSDSNHEVVVTYAELLQFDGLHS